MPRTITTERTPFIAEQPAIGNERAPLTGGRTTTPRAVADELVTEHLWLVDRLATVSARRTPSHVDREELWAAGVLGLVEASRRFDAATGVSFAAFASARVRGSMLDEARTRDLATRRDRRRSRLAARATEQLTQTLGRVPTIEEIAASIELPTDVVRDVLAGVAAATDLRSLDAGPPSSAARTARGGVDPAEELVAGELTGTLRDAVDGLPEPLRTVVTRSYWDGARLQDIAEELGLSFQRVAQYRSEAIVALHAWFAQLYDELVDPGEGPGASRRAAYCAAMATRSTWRTRVSRAG